MTKQQEENKKILEKLLTATSSDEVFNLIENNRFFTDHCEWIPYGGRYNNAGQVEGQMKDSTNALVEKITNSIDALLMRRCYEVDKVAPDSSNPNLPKNLSEALIRYFGNEQDVNKKRSEWAKQHFCILAEGDKKKTNPYCC